MRRKTPALRGGLTASIASPVKFWIRSNEYTTEAAYHLGASWRESPGHCQRRGDSGQRRCHSAHEVSHLPVLYFPIKDVKPGALVPTDRATQCALKGEANYYSLRLADGREIENAVWQYSHPYPGLGELADRVAFYAHVGDFRIGE